VAYAPMQGLGDLRHQAILYRVDYSRTSLPSCDLGMRRAWFHELYQPTQTRRGSVHLVSNAICDRKNRENVLGENDEATHPFQAL
jgi:hypothetical protein